MNLNTNILRSYSARKRGLPGKTDKNIEKLSYSFRLTFKSKNMNKNFSPWEKTLWFLNFSMEIGKKLANLGERRALGMRSLEVTLIRAELAPLTNIRRTP